MKTSLLPLLAVTALLVANSIAFAELPAEIETVIAVLMDAKESKTPLPLLEDAHKKLKSYNMALSVDKSAVASRTAAQKVTGIRPNPNNHAVSEHKIKALEAIDKAIETAKVGGDVKPKVENAIAHVRFVGDLRR